MPGANDERGQEYTINHMDMQRPSEKARALLQAYSIRTIMEL